jgi:molybdopterin-guanine dinucleotide biosynthesis protein A
MAGIVLSGGENQRMGTDKAFLKIDGIPIIEHILRALKSTFDKIIIVTNTPQLYTAYDAMVVTDAYDKRCPLTGIYSGLLKSTDEYNFIAACDMPFLNSRLISYMMGLASECDIVVPRIGGFLEPLHAVYSRGLIPVMENRIRRDFRQIQGIFGETGVRVRYVTEAEIDRYDKERRSFMNLNTPGEYKEAACSDLECRN